MNKNAYKNTIKTKKDIASAYLKLLNQNPNKLSVTDVVSALQISRGTFYLHFKNLQDVENYISQNLSTNFEDLSTAFRKVDIFTHPEDIINKLNELISKDVEYYKLLVLNNKAHNVIDSLKSSIYDLINNNFEIMKYVSNLNNFNIVVHFVVNGVINTYLDWLKGILNCSFKDLNICLTNIIKTGLQGSVKYGM